MAGISKELLQMNDKSSRGKIKRNFIKRGEISFITFNKKLMSKTKPTATIKSVSFSARIYFFFDFRQK